MRDYLSAEERAEDFNVTRTFFDFARSNGQKPAFIFFAKAAGTDLASERVITFQEIYHLVASYRAGLEARGVKKGDRFVVLTHIDLDFYGLVMALMSLGAVCVFLDPGVGMKKILSAIARSRARGIVSVSRLLGKWPLIPPLWRMERYCTDRKIPGVRPLVALRGQPREEAIRPVKLGPEDEVLITFTSGSTGRPKGADRNGYNLTRQMAIISRHLACDTGQIDFPSFPMFGLMNLFYGITTVLPAADFSAIGSIDPQVITGQMKRWGVTRMSGAYTYNEKIVEYLYRTQQAIETVATVVVGGTPVTREFCRKLSTVYPNGEGYIAYGSTEAAPIARIRMREFVEAKGEGFLVGWPCDGITVSSVRLPNGLAAFGEEEDGPYKTPPNRWGEIIIKGPHVVRRYIDNDPATGKTKIPAPCGAVWHRTGDTGYFDERGRLWLLGRVEDIITAAATEIHPFVVEGELDALEGVKRSALVQKGQWIHLALEVAAPCADIHAPVRAVMERHGMGDFVLTLVDRLPLDDRHNSKIDRITLKRMLRS